MAEGGARSTAIDRVGRYTLHGEIASGGMARVYFGKQAGAVGFSRIVAVKRMRPELAADPKFVAMFVDEATIAARVVHPNVVSTLDVVVEDREISIVTEYVCGVSLSALLRLATAKQQPIPLPVATSVSINVLHGLHAAHEARDKRGRLLGIVHRDVSPHNVLVDVDGVARIMDFGIAKASHRLHITQDGQIKGKVSYMAPEQFRTALDVDRRADVFAAAVVLWTALAGRRLFSGNDVADTMNLILGGHVPSLCEIRADVPAELEAIIGRALSVDREKRHPTAKDLALELEGAVPVAPAHVVGAWVSSLAADEIAQREARVAEIEDTGVDVAAADARSTAGLRELLDPTRRDLPASPPVPESTPASDAVGGSTSSALTLERLAPPSAESSGASSGAASADEQAIVEMSPPGRRARWVAALVVAGLAAITAGVWRAAPGVPEPMPAPAGATPAAADPAAAPPPSEQAASELVAPPTTVDPSPAAPSAKAVASAASSAASADPERRGPSPRATAAGARRAPAPTAEHGYIPPKL